jgi:hypothetical protein
MMRRASWVIALAAGLAPLVGTAPTWAAASPAYAADGSPSSMWSLLGLPGHHGDHGDAGDQEKSDQPDQANLQVSQDNTTEAETTESSGTSAPQSGDDLHESVNGLLHSQFGREQETEHHEASAQAGQTPSTPSANPSGSSSSSASSSSSGGSTSGSAGNGTSLQSLVQAMQQAHRQAIAARQKLDAASVQFILAVQQQVNAGNVQAVETAITDLEQVDAQLQQALEAASQLRLSAAPEAGGNSVAALEANILRWDTVAKALDQAVATLQNDTASLSSATASSASSSTTGTSSTSSGSSSGTTSSNTSGGTGTSGTAGGGSG